MSPRARSRRRKGARTICSPATLRLPLALLLLGTPASVRAAGITIAVEPGEAVRPEQARGPQLLRDSRGLLVVVDYVRGFVLGRFSTYPGLGPSPDPAEGIGLEDREFPGLPPTSTPQTSLPVQRGFPFETESSMVGSPCLVDLDRDGRSEIVVATLAGMVYAISHAGRALPGWPQVLDDEFFAPPSAGDLDGDGSLEVIVGGHSGWIYAWHLDGSPVSGWPITPGPGRRTPRPPPGDHDSPARGSAIFGAAAIADLDGDGAAEVCVADAGGIVRVLRGDGHLLDGWPKRLPSAAIPPNPPGVFASPAVGDLDGDGTPEIVVASNAYRVFAWHPSGDAVRGWPVGVPNRARAGYGDVAIGDIDGNGAAEVIVTSEHGFEGPATVAAFTADGSTLAGWPRHLQESAYAGPALGDLTGDGVPEVVAATIGGDAVVAVLNGTHAGPLEGWPVRLKSETISASPVIADLDGDGRPDILVAALSTATPSQTWLWALDARGRELPGYPILLPEDEIVRSSPGVADLDGDGDIELVVATELQNMLYAWDLDAPSDPRAIPWPSASGGPARDGRMARDRVRDPGTPGLGDQAAETLPPPGGAAEPLSTISFDLRRETDVILAIYTIQGRRIRQLLDHCLPPGHYGIRWDGRNDAGTVQPTGIYFYQLDLDGRATTKQLLLLK